MKRSVFVTILMLLLLPLIVLPLLSVPDGVVVGRISIPSQGIQAEIMTADMPTCDGCPILWQGGVATTDADLSALELWDMADVITIDGGHYVLEYVGIVPCIRVGRWLIGWRGIIRADGDMLLVNENRAYRFVRL